jgi:hypothetical protein
MDYAKKEAEMVMGGAVADLLEKTGEGASKQGVAIAPPRVALTQCLCAQHTSRQVAKQTQQQKKPQQCSNQAIAAVVQQRCGRNATIGAATQAPGLGTKVASPTGLRPPRPSPSLAAPLPG